LPIPRLPGRRRGYRRRVTGALPGLESEALCSTLRSADICGQEEDP
jgi:hypothetical protein